MVAYVYIYRERTGQESIWIKVTILCFVQLALDV